MVNIRKLTDVDAEMYWNLRLKALKDFPDAFLTTYEDSIKKENPIEETKQRLQNQNNFTLGAFDGNQLVGMVTLIHEQHSKLRHRATIVAMYVDTEMHGRGIGKALLSEAIHITKTIPEIEQIYLSVEAKNEPAKRLYSSLGFKVYAYEERAMKYDGKYLDEEHMVLFLT